ncbi:MAG TPA: MauE/DoxX family redox-associated membrane protein [Capillimicrobium sp.]|nr:MauE/DoxX family redox-associated membrane protein [Capillimicrobium sp.]
MLVAARAVLAAAFALAALLKLRDRRGTRHAVGELGVPAALAGAVAAALAPAELAIAAGLLWPAGAWWAAVAALAALALFSAVVARALAAGRRPACTCFGALSDAPIGTGTLARNAALAAPAVLLVAAGPSAVADTSAGLGVALAAALLAAGAAVARWRARRTAAGVGRPVPAFTLAFDDEARVGREDLPRDRPTLFVFVDPDCHACDELLPDLAAWQRRPGAPAIAIVGRGDPEAVRRKLAPHGLVGACQRDREVEVAFGVRGTPSAVLVAPDRTIAAPVATGGLAIATLVDAAVRGDHAELAAGGLPQGPAEGEPLPPVSLPDATGREVRIGPVDGRPTVVLALSPGCPFCEDLLDDLRAWEASPPHDLRLVVLASNERHAAALGLASSMLIDRRSHGRRAIGSRSTPAALLLDADGRVASGLARGARATRALLDLPYAPSAAVIVPT